MFQITSARRENFIRVTLAVLALVCISLQRGEGSAEAPISGDYVFARNSEGVTITKYVGAGGDVMIPVEIGGFPVIEIGTNAFANKSSLTRLTLPNTVRNIGDNAFVRCESLVSVQLGNGMTRIGNSAFDSCFRLPVINLISTITNIGERAFASCTALQSITVSAASIGHYAFYGCSSASVRIGEGARNIGVAAFAGCKAASGIRVPWTVTNIGTRAFGWSWALPHIEVDPLNTNYRSVDGVLFDSAMSVLLQVPGGKSGTYRIPEGVGRIGESSFSACYGLTNLNIPDSVLSIEKLAFDNCGFQSITIPSSVTNLVISALPSNGKTTSIAVVPSNPTYSSADGVLFDADRLVLLRFPSGRAGTCKIPPGTQRVGEGAFSGCLNLTDVILPETLSIIEESAFSGCTSLTNITIPQGVTKLGSRAFARCVNLRKISIPDSVRTIGVSSFQDCAMLMDCILPRGMTEIPESLFEGCTSMPALSIPDGIVRVGGRAFFNCANLRTLQMPDSVRDVGDQAFSSCWFLEEFRLPANLATLGAQALAGCGVKALTIDESNLSFSCLDGVLFDKARSVLIHYPMGKTNNIYRIPSTITTLSQSAFFDADYLARLEIPSSVINIHRDSFLYLMYLHAFEVDVNNPVFSSFDGLLYDQDRATLLHCPVGKSGSVSLPDTVKAISDTAFAGCWQLTNITLPFGLRSIGNGAFQRLSIGSIVIPPTVVSIGNAAFLASANLTNVYFHGARPAVGYDLFRGVNWATICYLPGMPGWGQSFEGRPVSYWVLPAPVILNNNVGLISGGNHFGFIISWASNATTVVEACTNLSAPDWQPLQTITITSGTSEFLDAQWADYCLRAYRVRKF